MRAHSLRAASFVAAVGIVTAVMGTVATVSRDREARAADAPPPAAPAAPGDAPAPVAKVETWHGYLFRDAAGRTRLGEPVIAMGVMAVPPHVVAEPVAAKLAPWRSTADDDWFFLNYALEEADGVAKVPGVLVTLRGPVDGKEPEFFGEATAEPRTMRGARLVDVERLDAPWLTAWSVVFRDLASPWRIAREADRSPAAVRAFAVRALEALRAMRAHPAPDAAFAAAVRTVDADAVVTTAFRREKERDLQRWLVDEDAAQGWKLPGLADLPPLPPTAEQAQALLLSTPTRAAFLAEVGKRWAGDLADVPLTHYVRTAGPHGGGTSWRRCTVADVRDGWSDADYAERRAVTQEVVGR